MSKETKKKIPGPFIAVVIIALAWAGYQFWPSSGGPDDTTKTAAVDPPESETPVETEPSTPGQPPSADGPDSTASESYETEGDQWSTYHGGPALTGAIDVTLSEEPELLWRFQADSSVYFAPVKDDEHIFFATNKGGVYALDFEGNEVWSKHYFREPYRDGRPRPERFDAPISCFGDTVLVGAIRGLLYAFDTKTGENKWTYDAEGPILGTANFHDPSDAEGDEQVFIIGQGDGALHFIELATGKKIRITEANDRCDGSPSIRGDHIVYGSCAAALHVYSATDGKKIKDVPLDDESQVAGGAAVAGGSAFVGSHSGRLFNIHVERGETLWTNDDSEDEIFETPAVNKDYVVFSSFDGSVYALDRETGKKIWSFDTEGLPTSPVIAGDKVVVTSDGILFLLGLTDGEVIWRYEISDEVSSPAIINGMIVVGSEDGIVSAYGSPAGV
jgi:outer membrane protein assembly factor BamB